MADFDLILSEKDQLGLIDHLLESGAQLVPFLAYEAPVWLAVSSAAELLRLVADQKLCGPVFVAWDEYDRYPYRFLKVQRQDGVRFFLKQGDGGPYLDFLPCATRERPGGMLITSGLIGYFPRYWIEELQAEVPLPPELKKHYAAVRRYVSSIASREHAVCRVYYVGHDARRALKSGYEAAVDGLVLA